MALHLSKDDVKLVANRLALSPRFWFPFLVALALGYLSIWKLIVPFAQHQARELFRQEVTNQIGMLFQQKPISNIVLTVAQSQATNMMQQQIAPEIAKFQSALGQMIAEMPKYFYSRMTNETIDGSNTGRVSVLTLSNEVRVFIKLNHVAVSGSLSGWIGGSLMSAPIMGIENVQNVAAISLAGEWPPQDQEINYNLVYVRDIQDTNLVQRVEFRGEQVYLDNVLAKFNRFALAH
jgi:hypothetical protein